ncbi:hypothetical protein I553_8980 [Mycobacterium xenopi 4042]|uniref:Diacylglycerol O-acyltransferase n=1 Tax=Mycobacterium xenopi 4042 TaxID=1299334 RepID=X8APK5_MYCXE|nr:hypothetical protein I553_8980 [Mycobacterium xenopi 4042]
MWIYEHAVDLDGLRQFHRNLGFGLLGRRIERSPLPFARPRWVLDRGPSDIDIAQSARPRAELSDWADERSQLPIDPEWGPGWHLGVLPLKDGCTAVTLVLSHYLVDGLGLAVTVADAVLGNTHDLGYAPPHSRTRLRAVLEDARQTARDSPEVARALVAAAKLARRVQRDIARPSAPAPVPIPAADADDVVVVPTVMIQVDVVDWDARAAALGATSNTLVAGLAVRLGERMGRRRASDGAVTLQLPINERTEGDTRANAMLIASLSVDPTRVTTDLRDLRAAIKQALRSLRETQDESSRLLWLTSFLPKPALIRLSDVMYADPNLPVFCSNLGELGSVVCRLDGTDSELVMTRVTAQQERRQLLERTGGQMTLQSWRIRDKIRISVGAYQPAPRTPGPLCVSWLRRRWATSV